MTKRILPYALVLTVCAILSACGSSKKNSSYQPRPADRTVVRFGEQKSPSSTYSVALLDEARSWLGTPYKYGGEDRDGIDCSGLVLQVFKNAIGVSVPRNSGKQAEYCERTQPTDIVPGDLVFFATGSDKKKISHVGIFMGENQMIHSSGSKGVILSDLSSDYYQRTFIMAGKVAPYHALIRSNMPKKPDGYKEPEVIEPEPPVIAAVTEEPVKTTAKKKPAKMSKAERKNAPSVPLEVIVPSAVHPTASTAADEPSTDSARESVLKSLKEKPLKK